MAGHGSLPPVAGWYRMHALYCGVRAEQRLLWPCVAGSKLNVVELYVGSAYAMERCRDHRPVASYGV